MLFGLHTTDKTTDFILKYSSENCRYYRTLSFWPDINAVTEIRIKLLPVSSRYSHQKSDLVKSLKMQKNMVASVGNPSANAGKSWNHVLSKFRQILGYKTP